MKGELGVNHSALEHGVQRTTLKDRFTGRVKHGATPGPVAYLNQKEEEELVKLPFQARAEMTTKEVFTMYFDLLKETLAKHDLLDKPAHIYNCDESGMPLQHKWPKTVAQRGTKKVRQRSSGDKTQISVLACGNGVGQAIPPMVIFAGKNFNYELSDGEVPGTFYGMSESGWMEQELFSKFTFSEICCMFQVDRCYSCLTGILLTSL